MKMISFSRLSIEPDEERTLLSIRAQMPGHCITLRNINETPRDHQEIYVVCQFVCKVDSKMDEEFGTVLELVCRYNEHKFKVIFFKKMSEEIQNLILHGRISVGDYLALQRPSLAVLYNKTNTTFGKIEIGQEESQCVIIWKSDSIFYIEPFLMHKKGYRRVLFYELDHTGSLAHAVSNLHDLAKTYGPVESLSSIAGSNAMYVALAAFVKLITPLKFGPTISETDSGVYIQVKFDEILLESKPYVSTAFIAFFFGELAKEIGNAVNNKLIEPGDLVALIYPHFDCKRSSPININFPPYSEINLIVLKNQYPIRDVGAKICLSDINISYSNNGDAIEGSIDDGVDYSPVEFSSLKNCCDVEGALLKINFKLRMYGDITSLKHLSGNNLQPLKKGIVLSYFLKLIKPYRITNKYDAVTIFLKEINIDCLYGVYFKLVLGKQFAESFYLAIKHKKIVRGDIICIVNPVVWKNSTYISSENRPSYLVEVTIPEKQRLVVLKLRKTVDGVGNTFLEDKSEFKCYLSNNSVLPDKHNIVKPNCENLSLELRDKFDLSTQILAQTSCFVQRPEEHKKPCDTLTRNIENFEHCNEINPPKKNYRQNNTSSKSENHSKKNDDESLQFELPEKQYDLKTETESTHVMNSKTLRSDKNIIPNEKQEQIDVSKTCEDKIYINTPFVINHHLISNISKDCYFVNNSTEDKINHKLPKYRQQFSLLPIRLTKPSLKNSIDLVSGFCLSGCKKMYPYSSTLLNPKESKPFCPRCSKVLKLDFCIEMIAFGSSKLITVLLHGVDAEKYLNLTCEQFLDRNEIDRKLIVCQIEEKLKNNMKFGKGNTIETTDATYWWYANNYLENKSK